MSLSPFRWSAYAARAIGLAARGTNPLVHHSITPLPPSPIRSTLAAALTSECAWRKLPPYGRSKNQRVDGENRLALQTQRIHFSILGDLRQHQGVLVAQHDAVTRGCRRPRSLHHHAPQDLGSQRPYQHVQRFDGGLSADQKTVPRRPDRAAERHGVFLCRSQ